MKEQLKEAWERIEGGNADQDDQGEGGDQGDAPLVGEDGVQDFTQGGGDDQPEDLNVNLSEIPADNTNDNDNENQQIE